jgi:hypothetical protein
VVLITNFQTRISGKVINYGEDTGTILGNVTMQTNVRVVKQWDPFLHKSGFNFSRKNDTLDNLPGLIYLPVIALFFCYIDILFSYRYN